MSKSKIDDCTDNDVFDVKAVISEADGMILFLRFHMLMKYKNLWSQFVSSSFVFAEFFKYIDFI